MVVIRAHKRHEQQHWTNHHCHYQRVITMIVLTCGSLLQEMLQKEHASMPMGQVLSYPHLPDENNL